MIPTLRFYLLLILGGAIAVLVAILFSQGVALGAMLFYDLALFCLGLADSYRVKKDRVEVTRSPLVRLSIGRDNVVELQLKNQTYPANIQIREDYPAPFSVSTTELTANLASQGEQTLTYSVHPQQRGKYQWENLHLRQLGRWGLAWLGLAGQLRRLNPLRFILIYWLCDRYRFGYLYKIQAQCGRCDD